MSFRLVPKSVILRPENHHQINNDRKPSHASSFATRPPRSHWQIGI